MLQNGEVISDAIISCGPRPGGNYTATIQYTLDLGVLKEAKYSPESDKFIGFDKIACIDFIEMNDEDLKVVKEDASYRNHILKMKVIHRSGEIIENAYFLDHCSYKTQDRTGSLQKIKARSVKIRLQSEGQYPFPKPVSAENIIILKMATDFRIGSIDSDKRTFYYISGSVLSYSEKGVEEGLDWYKINGVGDQGVFLKSYLKDQALTSDKRSFFKIAENGQAGYLANIWEGRPHLSSLYEDIDLVDDLAGIVKVRSDQITSVSSKRNEITIQTCQSGTFHGTLRDVANYRNESMTMGPCIVTSDAIIPLIRTAREHFLTLNRIRDEEKPLLKPELVFWDRSQFKFRLTSRGVNGFFDERIKDLYIQFTEKFLGGMRIKIPRIKRLSVDTDNKESPITVETFEGNTYTGKCNEQFNLSGTYISLDNVKSNFVLEALESGK